MPETAKKWNFREGTTITSQSGPDFEIGPEWGEVVGTRRLKSVIAVEYGLAEETIALLTFEPHVEGGPADEPETYEVGIGECLRPYSRLYEGTSLEDATFAFLEAIRGSTWL